MTEEQPVAADEEPKLIPDDLRVDLPFPMMVLSHGSLCVLARMIKSHGAELFIVDVERPQKRVAGAEIKFGDPPPGTTVEAYWTGILMAASKELLGKVLSDASQSIMTPSRQLIVPGNGGRYAPV
jgi:hypothetical protein